MPSGLTAVLFGVLPLYMALLAAATLPEEPLRRGARLDPLAQGPPKKIRSVRGGPAVDAWRRRRAEACASTSSTDGGVRRRGWAASGRTGVLGRALNGWAMLGGGLLLLAVSALSERWGATSWSPDSVFSILYLALFGTGFTFVTLTILIREMPVVTTSFISLVIPFGALALGALVRGEKVTGLAVAGALLVAGGIAVAQLPIRRRAPA